MNVLVINCGSSSLKYQVIDADKEEVLAKGLCERIGIDGRLVYQKAGLDKEITEAPMPTHKEAIQMVLDAITNDKTGALQDLSEVFLVSKDTEVNIHNNTIKVCRHSPGEKICTGQQCCSENYENNRFLP